VVAFPGSSDEVLYGINYGSWSIFISRESDEIGKQLTEKLGRGVTKTVRGGCVYSGRENRQCALAIKKRQIVELKKIVKALDKEAFVIISEEPERWCGPAGFEKTEV
jgi:uncharacterized membrane-anchored protein YitT (DUF2179 family)